MNSSVPIVFVLVANVVESGLVKSQALPGRNMTGFTNFEPAIAGKWLEVLKEAAPQIRRAVALFSPETSLYGLSMPYIETAGPNSVSGRRGRRSGTPPLSSKQSMRWRANQTAGSS